MNSMGMGMKLTIQTKFISVYVCDRTDQFSDVEFG